jgi:hypothetical protein
MRTRKYNPKRRIIKSIDEARLESLSKTVVYKGNPAHKKHPGDFGLTPPAQPRLNKTLCDGTQVNLQSAVRLLRAGAKLGLISIQERDGLPQNIWAVSQNGIALEAQLDNVEAATYHGYPMGSGDPLATEILARWKEGATSE